jgi:hypothetical protein
VESSWLPTHLKIHGMAFCHATSYQGNNPVGVAVEYVEMLKSVAGEKRPGHRPVEGPHFACVKECQHTLGDQRR